MTPNKHIAELYASLPEAFNELSERQKQKVIDELNKEDNERESI